MLSSRLSLALEDGVISLPDAGRIAVVSPAANADLSDLPREQVDVISRHFPVHQAFQAQGFAALVHPAGPYALTILCLPRAKAEARAALSAILPLTNGTVIVDGQKTDGVESVLKQLRKLGDVGEVVVKSHGKLFAFTGKVPADWAAKPGQVPRTAGLPFQTAPGVFSADGIDPGSAALAAALPDDLKGHVIDLGAGWGYLADALLSRPKVKRVDLVESDHAALEAARTNITDPRASFHWADALRFTSDPADHVMTNPPFHTGRRADPSLGQGFIKAAARLLRPKGRLWLVANRHLPYERTLDDAFGEVTVLAETNGFKVTLAQNPRRSRKG
jgi:16S rRNA (guanine1207-N2)-methyltransferase